MLLHLQQQSLSFHTSGEQRSKAGHGRPAASHPPSMYICPPTSNREWYTRPLGKRARLCQWNSLALGTAMSATPSGRLSDDDEEAAHRLGIDSAGQMTEEDPRDQRGLSAIKPRWMRSCQTGSRPGSVLVYSGCERPQGQPAGIHQEASCK